MARDLLGLPTEIVGVQSTEAPAYALSFAAGTVVTTETADTLADGMATRIPDPAALEMIREGAARIVHRDRRRGRRRRSAPIGRTRTTSPRAPAPPPLAALLQEKANLAGKRVGLILSGGNIDLELFRKWIGTEATAVGERALA